jgi:hypothetical protein
VFKKIMRLALGSVLAAVAASSFASPATQIWQCELGEDASEEGVMQMAKDWLAAARQVAGGSELQAYLYFPIAVNDTEGTDLLFVVSAPSMAEWGRFWDSYPTSKAAEMEGEIHDMMWCPDSAIWETAPVQLGAQVQ